MRILPLPSTDGRPACQLICQAMPVRLTVTGLAAVDLQALFQAPAGGTEPWSSPPSPEAIVIDNPDVEPLPAAPADARSLQLGADRVELASGQPARLHRGAGQNTAATHFPQSLYLCLAQQWARSGVFALHAAGIVAHGQGIVALGERMAGKSTLALSALAAGHQVVSDDWLLLAAGSDGHCRIERLRGYLAIRAGHVRDWLLPRAGLDRAAAADNGADAGFNADDGDGGADGNADTEHRQLFAIDQAPDPRFPPSAHVGHLWLLAPDRPRPEATRCQPETPAAALAGLIRAAMPLLLSAAFPVERKALMATANTLLQQVVPAAVGTGHDLVRAPARDWERLLEILAF